MRLSEAKVLVVDDEAALREIFAKWLRQSGCLNVRSASNGVEAVEKILESPVDVLITDVRMPMMDGVSLVRRLSELDQRIACIIFVSGFGDVDQREMYDLGVEAFLTKPFRLEELATALEHAIADRRTLWLSPMATPPRQSVVIDVDAAGSPPSVRSMECPSDEQSAGCFRLGRGGFSVRSPKALGSGKIAFQCKFASEHPPLIGEGFVRWRSRTDQAVGIEFAYLDSPGREWIIGQIAEQDPRSFIPDI